MMRAKTHVETISLGGGRQTRNALIVTELPYQVNKVSSSRGGERLIKEAMDRSGCNGYEWTV